jgi:hypothetical protein
MKKQALLIAFASALALGGATASFAQSGIGSAAPGTGTAAPGTNNRMKAPEQAPTTQGAPPSSGTGQRYVPGYGNTGAGSQPSGQ